MDSASDPAALKQKANELYASKKFDEALALYDGALLADPKDTAGLRCTILSNKIAVFIEKNHLPEALKLAIELTTSYPNFARGWQRLATIHERNDEFVKAVEAAERYVALQPSDETRQFLEALKSETQICVRVTPGCPLTEVRVACNYYSIEGSPVMQAIGIPIAVAREDRDLLYKERQAQYDNQPITFLMTSTEDGLASERWQSNIGTAIVCRGDGKDLHKEHVLCLFDFFDKLMDKWGNGPHCAQAEMNAEAFRAWLARYNKRKNTNVQFQP